MSTNDQYFTSRRFHEISNATGFDRGEPFATENEVREYFTVANMTEMFGSTAADLTVTELADMAADVIENRFHCAF